ncbi:MAG: O-antigen ligase family protein [Flavobacteriales bacterium]|nr:O-antigen ligase family protein [Flavobacteriales bacterium]
MLSILRKNWIVLAGVLFVLVNMMLIYTKDFYFLNLLPAALLVLFGALFALDKLFWFVVICTPLSLNLEEMAGGIGIYLPTEPILFIIMLIFFFKQVKDNSHRDRRIVNHPISIAIYFHFAWIFITSLTSSDPLVSFKFLLSQLWFVVPCYFFAIWLFREKISNALTFIWCYLIPLSVVLVITVIKHAAHGFDEEVGHWIMSPFFKDHTSYGAIIALFYPVVVSMTFYKKYTFETRALLFVLLIVFTIALFYSYTRAAYLSVVGAGLVYLLFKFKIKFKYLLALGMFAGIIVAANWTEINYMLMKNDAEHTTQDVSERIQSMSNVSSDASNLERLNRWNSALAMFKERPVFGFGPGTYAMQYAPFQRPEDETIISTNFGTGGNAHSEYLGPLAEQGVFGLFSMIWLVVAIFYTSSMVYIRLQDKELKRIVMMLMLGLVTYFAHGVLNNYLDTDKASVPVWGFVAIIVAIDVYHSRNEGALPKESASH